MNLSRYGVFLVTLLLGGMAPFAHAQEPANFQGVWDMEETGGLTFGLELYQKGETLSGYHCGMTSDASRIDCSLAAEDDASITGSISGNVAKIRFTSAYSGQIGMAKLTLRDDSLLWEITAYPNGVYYLPDQAVLTKTVAAPADDERLERLYTLVTQDLQDQNYAYPVQYDDTYVAYADLNNDSIEDVIAIFYAYDESIDAPNSDVRSEERFLAIGFGTSSGDVTLALNEQGVLCLDCGDVFGEPEIRLTVDAGILTLSSYGGANWIWKYVQKIRYEDGAFTEIGYSESSSHRGSGLTFGYDVNLNTLEAVRNFDYGEGEEAQGSVRFRHLMANYASTPVTIDGMLNDAAWLAAQTTNIRQASDVVYKPENWAGTSDLSFAAATVWDDDQFYIGLVVEDDRVVPVESWDAILKGDHLELWLDVADSLVQWDVEGRPLRRKPDGQMMQIGVGIPDSSAAPVIRMLYPELPEGTSGIVAAASRTQSGYMLEISIPRTTIVTLLSAETEWQWDNGSDFGLSLVLSDTDDPQNRRQDCLMATSAVQWGNPYTFGVCSLVGTYAKPHFPIVDWPARY